MTNHSIQDDIFLRFVEKWFPLFSFAGSLAWISLLVAMPFLQALELSFWITTGFIGLNFVLSIWFLFYLKMVVVLPNLIQPVLYCCLSCQLYQYDGAEHYEFDVAPQLLDWIQLIVLHLCRAVDVFDVMEGHGIDFLNLKTASLEAGLILVFLHLTIDIFLLSLLFGYARKVWEKRRKADAPAVNLQETACGLLFVCIVLVVLTAWRQKWDYQDWVLWPVDNLLRVVDVADAFQIFHWKLHSVAFSVWVSFLAVFSRICLGILIGGSINRFRLKYSLGQTTSELIQFLNSPHSADKLRAIEALERLGARAQHSIPGLEKCLKDSNAEVRAAAVVALSKISEIWPESPTAQRAISDLVERLADENPTGREAVSRALPILHPQWWETPHAQEAIPELVELLVNYRPEQRKGAADALDTINAQWWETPEARQAIPGLVKRLTRSNPDVRKAAITTLGKIGELPETAMSELVNCLPDDDPTVQQVVVEVLIKIGSPATSPLKLFIGKSLGQERKIAEKTLQQIESRSM